MAYIVKRTLKGGRHAYLVRYHAVHGQVISRQFRRQHDAKTFADSTEVAKSEGTWIDPKRGKVLAGEWIDEWRRSRVHLAASTLARDDSYIANHLQPRWEQVALVAIQNADVRSWVSDLQTQGLAAATVRKVHQLFAAALDAAVDDRRLPNYPARRIPLPKVERTEIRFLTLPEVHRLADVIDPRYRTLIVFAAYSGLRFGELAALRWGRVDPLRRRIEVREDAVEVRGHLVMGPPKTASGWRTVPIPTSVTEALATLTGPNPDSDGFVFTAPQGGMLRIGQFRRRVWAPAVRAAGLGHVRIHDLRHTAVSLWIAAGVGVKDVSVRAGHSSASFTLDRYTHLFDTSQAQMSDALDAYTAQVMKGN